MDTVFEKYLCKIDRCLKPLRFAERVDIVKEIEGSIQEMQNENLAPEQILERLGSPKELARAYLGELIIKERGCSKKKLAMILAFYSLTGLSGMFVIPVLGILAPVLIFCAAVSPIAGLIKFVGFLFGYDVPYIMFQFGSVTLSPIPAFVLSIVMGAVLLFLGRGAWKLLMGYIKTVSNAKRNLCM